MDQEITAYQECLQALKELGYGVAEYELRTLLEKRHTREKLYGIGESKLSE